MPALGGRLLTTSTDGNFKSYQKETTLSSGQQREEERRAGGGRQHKVGCAEQTPGATAGRRCSWDARDNLWQSQLASLWENNPGKSKPDPETTSRN